MKTPKTDCAYTKTKNSISLDSRFVDLENTGFPATLKRNWLLVLHKVGAAKVLVWSLFGLMVTTVIGV